MKTKQEIKNEINRLYEEGGDCPYVDIMATRETLEWVLEEIDELPA